METIFDNASIYIKSEISLFKSGTGVLKYIAPIILFW